MRKKFLLMLTLLIIALGGGGNLFAEETTPVAKVGNTEYATIDDAIAAWTNGTTLTLLADVTLSDVVKLSSKEHHILDLGTYTMTAASGNNAIEITCQGLSNATYAITVNADANNPGGITATGKACIYYSKSGSTKDRPIIRIYNGVFNGSYSINSKSNGNTNCPQIWIYGGTFNGNVNLTKNMLRVFGGVFNGWINCTGDQSAYREISGGSFKSWQFMTADADNKFWVGTSKANYDVGCYVDDNGYLVVGGPIVTEPNTDSQSGVVHEASTANYGGWSSYLKYSSAKDNGLYYTSVKEALADNNKSAGSVTVYVDKLDMSDISYKGTIVVPAGSSLIITNAPANLNVITENGFILENENGTYTSVAPVAKVGEESFATLSAAFAAVTDDNQTVVVLQDVTENLTSTLRGNITTENAAKVTITLTNSDWVYCPYTFVVGENITLNIPAFFYYAGGTQINGTVVAGAYYQRYGGTKLTINEPGSMTVTTEQFYLCYVDGDANAGIYINGDNNDETIGLNLAVAYFYQGMINAKNANIKAGTYWQTNETDGQGTANLVLDNSKLVVSVYDHPAKATGNSTVTLTNGSVFDAKNGGFTYGDATVLSVDATSRIIGKGGEDVKLPVAKIGTTNYKTLAEAVKAVQEGQTITIFAGEISEGTIKLPSTLKNVKFLGAAEHATVLKDMTIKSADGNSVHYEGLKFDGITFDNSNVVLTGWRTGEVVYKDITVTNCIFKNIVRASNNEAAFHINCDVDEAVNGFTFTNNVIDGVSGDSNSGVYAQLTGNVTFTGNVINNVAFRPYVIQITTNDDIADTFTVTGNTFSGSAVGRAQGLGSNAEGTDNVNIVVSNNIFKGITDAQQICYWNFNAEKTTAVLSGNYYDIDVLANPGKIYFNTSAQGVGDLVEMGIFPYYTELNADGTINTESAVQAPAAIAKIDDKNYYSLQDAINAVQNNETITLVSDVTEDVVITQRADVNVVIDGAGNKFNGLMSIDGAGRAEGAETLTIKNINFVAKAGEDASIDCIAIVSPNHCYAHNVTISDCTFTDVDGTMDCAAVRQDAGLGGGAKNWSIIKCTVDNTMHSLVQVSNITGVVVDGCIVKSKNGINLNSSSNVKIMDSTIEVSGYAVRAGVDGGTSGKIELTNNTLKTNGSEDAVVVIRGAASEQIDLTMTGNVVSGITHISGTTAGTKISADANYWDGNDAPVVNGVDFLVNSYYSDAELTILVKKHYGNDFTGYTSTDGIWGEVWGNAFESFVIKVLDANNNVMGTTSLNNVGGIINGNVNVSWSLKLDAESNTDEYWTMSWVTKPTINNMPAKVELWVDDVKVSGGNVVLNGPDNLNKINAAITNANKEIKSFQTSFANALAAVQTGETIELFADVKATEVILLDKSITINGNDHNVTSSATRVFRVTTSNTKVTLNDVNMVSTAVRVGTNDIRGISIDAGLTNVQMTLNNCSVYFTDASACDWAYAVNVSGNGTGHNVKVIGGTYEGANVINVHGANNTIDVQGATLTSLYPYSESYYGACIYVAQDQNSSVTATYNTFNGRHAVAFNVGYTPVTESNNTDNTTRIIAEIDGKYYTLQEAIEAAGTTETTITIMASFSTDDYYTIDAGQNITLDLNGMTITGTDKTEKSFGLINNKGTLTIVDNSNNRAQGALKLSATVNSGWSRYSSVISNQPGGKLIVNGGTIEHLGGTDMAYAIDNLTNGKGTYAETIINGGTVKSTYRAIRQFLNGIEAQNILTVNGGTIEGTNKSIWMQDPSKNANTGTLIVNANANLYGDVYLSVTEGSTEWPVDVAIVADAIKQGTVLTSNVPEGYLLVAENGLYTVETIKVKEQTINLNNGWTWVSLFVDATGESGLESFENQLEQYNADNQIVQIKNQTKAVTYQSYYGNYGWYGNLKSLAVNDMYMVKIEKDNVVVELEDYKVNPADYEFNLVSGWTWLGFPSTSDAPVAIEYALQNITPNKGDQIKSQEGFATYTNNKWYGNLSSMTPGMGYMYKNNSDNTVTLKYPAEVNYRGVAPANITAKNNLMVPNMSKYANNMSIIAVVNIDGEELMTEDFEVAVFAGEELRGSARPIYVEDFNSYMLFLTVYGEASEELTFKYYDLNSGEELNLFADSKVVFEVNSIVGSVEQPSVLNYGTLSIDETSLNGFNVYPNPVNRDNAISFETTFDKVEVYNSLGVVVAEYNNVDKIDGIEAAGIYVIKVTNDNVVKYCRVIVK